MENKIVLHFLAGVGAVSIVIWGYNKFIAKPSNTLSATPISSSIIRG